MNPAALASRRLLVRNSALNVSGQVISTLIAIFTIPYLIHGLGTERFGVLSIAWLLVGYFSLFDVGLGRATTKHVADALGRTEHERIPTIIWTSLSLQALLGVAGAVTLAALAPVLTQQIFKISATVIAEATSFLYVISISIPIVIVSASLRGALEASQRFDLVNLVKVPASSFTILMPAVGLLLGCSLPGIAYLLLLSMSGTAVAYLMMCFRVYPALKSRPSPRASLIPSLLHFGLWVGLCNVLIPVLVSVDKLLLGALVSVVAVGYYTAPYEIIARAQIIPGSLGLTLFPAFAALANSDRKSLGDLYAASLKYTAVVMTGIAFVAIIFAEPILDIWLGSDFALQGTLVLQILSVGVLLNAVAQIPAHLLDGVSRPDLRAKVLLSYVVLYIALAWVLIDKFGIVGAALAWAIRAAIELPIFLIVCHVVVQPQFARPGLTRLTKAAATCLLAVTWAFVASHFVLWQLRIGAALLGVLLFVAIFWFSAMDTNEQKAICRALTRKSAGGAKA